MSARSEGQEVALARSVIPLTRHVFPQWPRKVPINVLLRRQIWSSLVQVPNSSPERGFLDDAAVKVRRGVRNAYTAMRSSNVALHINSEACSAYGLKQKGDWTRGPRSQVPHPPIFAGKGGAAS